MKLSIRKARRIEQKLGDMVAKLPSTQLSISIFTEEPPDITDESAALKYHIIQLSIRNRIRFIIRGLISDFNQSSGISTLMTKENSVASAIELYSSLSHVSFGSFSNREFMQNVGIETKRYENDSYSTAPVIHIPLLDKDDVDEYAGIVETLTKEKQDISDTIFGLNVTGEIDLDDDLATVLIELNLV